MDTLQNLRMFVEAVRAESLSAAARNLGISPATVSRGIDALERHLGFNLLVKTSRQLGLTEAGDAYLPKIERLLLELDDATEFARGFQAEAEGMIRVHSRMAVGALCIAPIIPEFLRRYPRIKVHLSLTTETSVDLIKNNVDVDVRTGVLEDSSLIARKLADSRRVIVASPAYLERYGVPLTPYDLENHNCITFRRDTNPVIWRFRDASAKEIEIRPTGNLETDNGGAIQDALRAGVGIGHMTDWSVADQLRSGRLIALLQAYEVTVDKFNHGIYAVFLPSRNHSMKVRAFLDFLAEAFKSQAFFHGFETKREGQASAASRSLGPEQSKDDCPLGTPPARAERHSSISG